MIRRYVLLFLASSGDPIRKPYAVYLQGGLTYDHGKLALIRTFQHMRKQGLL